MLSSPRVSARWPTPPTPKNLSHGNGNADKRPDAPTDASRSIETPKNRFPFPIPVARPRYVVKFTTKPGCSNSKTVGSWAESPSAAKSRPGQPGMGTKSAMAHKTPRPPDSPTCCAWQRNLGPNAEFTMTAITANTTTMARKHDATTASTMTAITADCYHCRHY